MNVPWVQDKDGKCQGTERYSQGGNWYVFAPIVIVTHFLFPEKKYETH